MIYLLHFFWSVIPIKLGIFLYRSNVKWNIYCHIIIYRNGFIAIELQTIINRLNRWSS